MKRRNNEQQIKIEQERAYKTAKRLATLGIRERVYRVSFEQHPTTDDPTPEQIRERCVEIQQGWSDTELIKRSMSHLPPDKN